MEGNKVNEKILARLKQIEARQSDFAEHVKAHWRVEDERWVKIERQHELEEARDKGHAASLARVDSHFDRLDDRTVGMFISAAGLSIVAIAIGFAAIRRPEEWMSTLFLFGGLITFAGLFFAFTNFLNVDLEKQPLLQLSIRKPHLVVRHRKRK
jgi:hypothetical protein